MVHMSKRSQLIRLVRDHPVAAGSVPLALCLGAQHRQACHP